MHTIILDTSFLITAMKDKVDMFAEFERICAFPYTLKTIDKTLDELKGKPFEKLILALLERFNVGVVKTSRQGHTDDLIVNLKQKDLIIATQDQALKKRLSTPIITIRQKKYLQLQGL